MALEHVPNQMWRQVQRQMFIMTGQLGNVNWELLKAEPRHAGEGEEANLGEIGEEEAEVCCPWSWVNKGLPWHADGNTGLDDHHHSWWKEVQHHEIWKYYQSTCKACAKVHQNLIVCSSSAAHPPAKSMPSVRS